jgi:hypothetical protein
MLIIVLSIELFDLNGQGHLKPRSMSVQPFEEFYPKVCFVQL